MIQWQHKEQQRSSVKVNKHYVFFKLYQHMHKKQCKINIKIPATCFDVNTTSSTNLQLYYAEAASRDIGLEVSADKTKYMVMSRDQNAGRIQSVRIDNSTFERVEEFKYLGTTLMNQNSIAEEMKSRLR